MKHAFTLTPILSEVWNSDIQLKWTPDWIENLTGNSHSLQPIRITYLTLAEDRKLDSTSCQSTEGWAPLVDCGGVYYSTGYVSTEFTWRCNVVTESKNADVQNGFVEQKRYARHTMMNIRKYTSRYVWLGMPANLFLLHWSSLTVTSRQTG